MDRRGIDFTWLCSNDLSSPTNYPPVRWTMRCLSFSFIFKRYFICVKRAYIFQTVHTLEKTLDHENQSLYNKLGLHWRLVRRPVDLNHSMTEYVLLLEMLPKAPLLLPD